MTGKSGSLMNRQFSLKERGDDLYQTHPAAVLALCRAERIPKRIWEPACGPGSITRTLRARGHEVLATDLVDYQSSDQDRSGIDFTMSQMLVPFEGVADGIVTNPPYKLAQEFVEQSLTRVPYVAMLLRLAFLESQRRTGILERATLARVHVFRKRLPMMHRDGWGGKKASSNIPFAWFVWDASHTGPVNLHRISWEGDCV